MVTVKMPLPLSLVRRANENDGDIIIISFNAIYAVSIDTVITSI